MGDIDRFTAAIELIDKAAAGIADQADVVAELESAKSTLQFRIERRQRGVTIDEVRNPKVGTVDLKLRDYVFASKFGDCSPGDPWCLGFVREIGDGFVVLEDEGGNLMPGVGIRGFRHAMKIDKETGHRIKAMFPKRETWGCSKEQIADIITGANPGD